MLIKAVIDAMYRAWLSARTQLGHDLEDEGQGLVEYALILVLVAVVVIVILAVLGPALGNIFSNIVCGVLDVQKIDCRT